MMNAASTRLLFWRITLALTGLLALLAAWQMFGVAHKLGITVQTSKTWLALLSGLGLVGFLGFVGAVLTFYAAWQIWFNRFDFAARLSPASKFAAAPLLALSLLGYSLLLLHPYYGKLIRGEEAARFLVFWLLALWGAWLWRVLRPQTDWPAAFGLVFLLQAAVHLVAAYLLGITDYPFALGWSETSRFYYPSLFLSEKIYGERLPWPILHPSLHLVLVPPYWFDSPLWVHRAWQILIRFVLVGCLAPALLARLKVDSALWRFAAGVWIFLAAFNLPLYLHLAPPVLLLLWGFSAKDTRRTWIFLLLASVWAGLSRINWYPVPGMIAAALFLLEAPYLGRSWRYLLKPAAWFIAGSVTAFLSMQAYIALSGIEKTSDFYTSLTSSLLWYRLWPNATYALGVLPGIALYSLPMWIVLALVFARRDMHPLRVGLLLLGLAVLFAGGIVVSMKIGGGGDIHNMDAYGVALIIVAAYLFFGRYAPDASVEWRRDNSQAPQPMKFHWLVTALLVLSVVWFAQRASIGIVTYDKAESRAVLTELQRQVASVNARGGEILFITQRHLISMNLLHSVRMIPEYEREELMEMAMANNEVYLDQFKADLRAQRFDLIVVDPLTTTLLGSDYAMGEENNAWVRFVARPILCNYRAQQTFAADRIVLYVPQETPACP
ncbi:MAG: hypothetical protein Fur0016_11050 [Anaerolineales bacterium]